MLVTLLEILLIRRTLAYLFQYLNDWIFVDHVIRQFEQNCVMLIFASLFLSYLSENSDNSILLSSW